MSIDLNQEQPIVRENFQEDIVVEEEKVVEEESPSQEEEKVVEESPPQEEETAAPAAESSEEAPTPEGSTTPEPTEGDDFGEDAAPDDLEDFEQDRLEQQADQDLEDLFDDDDVEDVPEEDGPVGEKAVGSNEKPSTSDSALKNLYDTKQAEAAKEKARRHAMDADGSKTTALVEATTDLVDGGEEVVMDDLAWLNEEEENYTFEDLFPEMDEELALEDGTAPALALQDEASAEVQQEQEAIKTNAFEEGLERLKRKRQHTEMTPEQAEDKMEDLICKMTTAADEDCEVIRRNMAKDRLQIMCEKAEEATKEKRPYLGKGAENTRFQKLYRFAQFPNGREVMKSYFDKNEKYMPAAALAGTRKLMSKNGAEPALAKVSILKHCTTEINKPTHQSWFVTFGGLSVLKTWLTPSPDGTLPALSLRTEILRTLEKLPVTQTNLRKSKLGVVIKELLKRDDETLSNRKLCRELINKWLSLVLDAETSIRRHRAQIQHDMRDEVEPVAKRRKTKQEIAAKEKEVQERRHPEMYQKPSHNFKIQPGYNVTSEAGDSIRYRQTRKGKVAKCAGELRCMRPNAKHEHVSVSGTKINLTFGH